MRSGSSYSAASQVGYDLGGVYHVRMAIDVVSHTYSVYVRPTTPAGASEVTLGQDMAFRTEQAGVVGRYTLELNLQHKSPARV